MNEVRIKKSAFYTMRKTFILVFATAVIFSAGYVFGYKGFYIESTKYPTVKISREIPPDKSEIEFSLFWKVWDTISEKYYDKAKMIPAKMVYGAIRGMVASIGDPYTIFLEPSENKVIQEDLSGSFEGVGIQIGFKGNQLAVIAPLPGSPAEREGIKAGDLIIGIKDPAKNIDISTAGITLPQAVQAIRGKAGSVVTLALLRDGVDGPIVVDVTREKLNVPSVTLTYKGDKENIAYIKLQKFAAETQGEWDDAVLQVLAKQGVIGVIVDLRNNPGGYLQTAVDLSSDFLDVGDVAVIEESSDGHKQEYKTQKIGRLKNRQTVVLINGGSASSSEILAGALRDNKSIKLVGEKSFGKGTIQEPEQIDNGAGLHITIARWLTPKGTWVNENGLDPDVVVSDNSNTEDDEQLMEAMKLLTTSN